MGITMNSSGTLTVTNASGKRLRNRWTASETTSSTGSSDFVTWATPRSSWMRVMDSRFSTMVVNLLSITRIQDASVPLKKREEMLEEVAGDAVLTTRRRFPDANVQLDLSEDILFLPMEPMLIKQVIVNLLENAVRHSGDTQHIQLHLFRQEEWAVVEVRDHGIGLSPDIMQAVQSGRPLPRDLSGDSTRGMGIGPVSYTHLDVYKRQAPG